MVMFVLFCNLMHSKLIVVVDVGTYSLLFRLLYLPFLYCCVLIKDTDTLLYLQVQADLKKLVYLLVLNELLNMSILTSAEE